MNLILDIPEAFIKKFGKYSSTEIFFVNYLKNKEIKRTEEDNFIKPRWLGYDHTNPTIPTLDKILQACYNIGPDYVISLGSTDSSKNIICVERLKSELQTRGLTIKIISVWAGSLWELPILQSLSSRIGIPYYLFRGLAEKEIDITKCHFLGYKYKDELRKYKPESLNTSIPFRAAAIGIDLRTRNRRPKGLPPFNPNQGIIFAGQESLIKTNIEYIKEDLCA